MLKNFYLCISLVQKGINMAFIYFSFCFSRKILGAGGGLFFDATSRYRYIVYRACVVAQEGLQKHNRHAYGTLNKHKIFKKN